MGVIRVEHTSDYTVMSNAHLRDQRLSLRAMGLMSKMLSNADSYEYSIAGLASVCREGRDAVRKALQELEAAGYLVREQTRKGGSFSACDYTLFEHPRGDFAAAAQSASAQDSPLTENPTTVTPTTVFPSSANPTQRNTNRKEVPTEEPPIAPRTGGRRGPKAAPDWKPERFAKFWQLYPRGEAKQAAIKAWDTLKADDELLIVMGRALVAQMASREWREGIGIPYAATWLNQRRWTDQEKSDEPLPPPASQKEGNIRWI